MDWPLHSFMQNRIKGEKTGGYEDESVSVTHTGQIYPRQMNIKYICSYSIVFLLFG
jgi:hypothetical protein